MKALRLVEIGKPLVMQEVPMPRVGEKDALVRVMAAGICHSDAHYRAGTSSVGPLPHILGHEISGVVDKVGVDARGVKVGDRVCVHYQLGCGDCYYCRLGNEHFCVQGAMIGKHCNGGYAEYIAVPARNLVLLPGEVSFEQGAVMMCSSATSYHALRRTRLTPGETVAVFGVGGLGNSAIQLAKALGALAVYAVDIREDKLKLAEERGAIPVNATKGDAVDTIRQLTGGRGVDVALELIGLPETMRQSIQSLTVFGRAGLAGITTKPLEIDTYRELLGREAEIIGCSDHLMHELPLLMELSRQGRLNLADLIDTVPLDAELVNGVLDALVQFGGHVRTVIVPAS